LKEEIRLGPETRKPPAPAASKEPPRKEARPATAVGTRQNPGSTTRSENRKATTATGNSRTEKTPPPPPPVQAQKSGGGCAAITLALLALTLSLGVGGAGFYLWQQIQTGQQQTVQQMEQNLTARMGEFGTSLQENNQKVISVEKEITALKSELDALRKQQQELRTLQHDTTLQELASLNEKITTINSSMDATEQRLTKLLTQQQNITSRINEASPVLQKLASIDEVITALSEKVETTGKRQQKLLDSLKATRTQAEQERHTWKLAEAEFLLKVATHRLDLEHDISGAIAALENAGKTLAETDNSRWQPVQEAISAAITELNALPRPDIGKGAATIASLENAVDQLPLPQPERHLQSTTLDTSELSQQADLQNWSSKMWDEVKKLVVIRRGDKPATIALMPPDQADNLRQNLQLKLESARYALLRNNPQLFRENLRIAQEWVEAHFDTKAKTTQSMLENLQKLQKTTFAETLPDISAPLEQLRKLRNQTPQEQEISNAAAEGASL